MKNWIFIFLAIFFCSALLAQSGKDSLLPKIEKSKAADTNSIAEEPVTIKVDKTAEFPGGDAAFITYITDNFNYPPRCHEEGINGYVLLRFIVNKKGKVSKVEVLEGTKSCPEFSLEAVRVLENCPDWIPGVYNGKPVVSYRQLPIRLGVE